MKGKPSKTTTMLLVKISFVLLFLLSITSCSHEPKNPTELLWGQWEYVESNNGYNAFEYDIEFASDGTFLIPESPTLLVNTFEYGLLEGNRLRLTAMGISEIFAYDLEGDTLKLIVEDGYILYHRKNLKDNGFTETSQKPDGNENAPTEIDAMVLVSAGEFLMGCVSGDEVVDLCEQSELPLHTVYLDEFYIDKTEVTNAQYAQCVKAGVCDPPSQSFSTSREWYYGNPEYDNYPVIFVTWYNAQDYCAWAGKRLPTEAEWEKAAGGTTATIYPWGDHGPEYPSVNYNNTLTRDTKEVGQSSYWASSYGAFDMAGNVNEWVGDWYSESYYSVSPDTNPQGPDGSTYKVIRGGSWISYEEGLRVAARDYIQPNNSHGSIGFRCASSSAP